MLPTGLMALHNPEVHGSAKAVAHGHRDRGLLEWIDAMPRHVHGELKVLQSLAISAMIRTLLAVEGLGRLFDHAEIFLSVA